MVEGKILIPVLIAVGLLAGCGSATPPFECTDAIDCVEIAPGDPIKIGVLQSLSGELALQGRQNLQCIELVLDDRGGEFLGHPTEIHSADSQCSGEGGTTAALKVAADPQIVGIIGPTCSGAAATAMKVLSKAGLVAISASSSSPSLTSVAGEQGPDWQPGFLRTAQNDALVGRAAATYAFEQLGVTRAATIDDGDPYTRGLADTFEQAFTELGGQVVMATAVNKGDTDMQPVLTAVAASGAELLFFPVFRMEGDYIVLQANDMDELESVTLMSAEGLYFDAFIEAVGQAGVGMYFNTPMRPEGPDYDAFMTRYQTKYNELPTSSPYPPHTYDAVNLLLDTIGAVAVQEEDGTLHIGRQALRDALYATAGYQGLTGSLTCDQYGDCGGGRFQVVRLDDPAAGLEGVAANVVYTYPDGE
ncbi:MAG: branched-chain amino acid ABC transporter substrate-binding protein [Anaerolineae bacterium]|jgi:branched-chain amino acid transport system substrate-binding protein